MSAPSCRICANRHGRGACLNVLFIYQPNKSTMDAGGYEEYDLVIAKQRNGPAGGRIPLRFKKAWGLFSE